VTRDETIAALSDRLADGDTIGKVSLFDVLSGRDDWCSLDDFITLTTGSFDDVLNVQDRLRDYHRGLCSAWLQTSARGQAAVDAEIDEDAELQAERSAA
jgi:hypothetical protein